MSTDEPTALRDPGVGLTIRAPAPPLRPLVRLLWASEARPARGSRERVLPTGAGHLAIRTRDVPVRLFAGAEDRQGESVASAVLSGPRSRAYVKGVSPTSGSVGAQLHAGALYPLCRESATALAERHVGLGDVWGRAADEIARRLREERCPQRRMDLLERFLLRRLVGSGDVHPAVARAVHLLTRGRPVAAAVAESGYSHRHFLTLFQRQVGLSPKVFSRVVRLRKAVRSLAAGLPLVDAALAAGFADQPHLTREFRRIAGLSPGEYVGLAPEWEGHVPIPRAEGAVQIPSRQRRPRLETMTA